MLRWTREILCGLSLILFLTLLYITLFARKTATGITLNRSDQVPLANATIRTPHFYYLEIFADKLVVGHWRHPQMFERQKQSEKEQLASLEKQLATIENEPWRSRVSQHISELRQERGKNFYDRPDGFTFGAHGGLYVTPIKQIHSFVGIKYDGFPSLRYPANGFRCVVPIGWVLPLLLLAPFIRGFLFWRCFRRPSGHCSVCGYDLRASSGKCPECGTVCPPVAPHAVPSPSP